jgi:hypothetical protein
LASCAKRDLRVAEMVEAFFARVVEMESRRSTIVEEKNSGANNFFEAL